MSYRDTRIEALKLPPEALTSTTTDGTEVERITKGGFLLGDREIDPDKDDIVFHYVNLWGAVEHYRPTERGKYHPYRRVRHQHPEMHLDREGIPKKYNQPFNSGSHLWIPELVLQAFRSETLHDQLILIEGELKAEVLAACGFLAIGVPGIHQISEKGSMFPEVVDLIIKCQVKNVIFLVDLDWKQISEKAIRENKAATTRPSSFYHAILNYQRYMRSLVEMGHQFNIWWGSHKGPEKGADDWLTGSGEKYRPNALTDFKELLTAPKEHENDNWMLHKISATDEHTLKGQFGLQNPQQFGQFYQDQLEKLDRWKWRGDWYRHNAATKAVELAQALSPDEKFFKYDDKGNLAFHYTGLRKFLQLRNYGRMLLKDGQSHILIRQEGQIVEEMKDGRIKDYVMMVAEDLGMPDLVEMLLRSADKYLGTSTFSNMFYRSINWMEKDATRHFLYFRTKYWEISAAGIKEHSYSHLPGAIWESHKLPYDPTLEPKPLCTIKYDDAGTPDLEFTGRYEECVFLKFLYLTSSFDWKWQQEHKGEIRSIEAAQYDRLHFMRKLTAMAYIIHDWKNPSYRRAVMCMDGVSSEVGQSNGRTGKSLFGLALEKVVDTVRIDGKRKDLTADPFLYEQVTAQTRLLYIDDARRNLDFEHFFSVITGDMTVNVKGKSKFTLSDQETPKLLITTNHALSKDDVSTRDRICYLPFSDYFNEQRKPIDEFGHILFAEWNEDQWSLYYNLIAAALQCYFIELERTGYKSGVIEAPMDKVHERSLLQAIGNEMLEWADTYFSAEDKIDTPLDKKIAYSDFLSSNPTMKWMTATSWKTNMKKYCELRELHWNPQAKVNGVHKPGADIKKGGIEYITVSKTGIVKETAGLF